MSKSSARSAIRLRGVRHNNLKNFDLDLPLNQLIVVTGLSGSGKSSLAFDTLFAEGQRRYIETFSPYARQFFDRMDKPQVDSIEGIPPAIAIEQRNAVKTTRSTVGTMTEIADYMKLLWPHISQLHCRQCGQLVRKDSPQQVWQTVNAECRMPNGESAAAVEILITFDLPLAEKISLEESLALISKQGYQRLLIGGEFVRIEEAADRIRNASPSTRHLTVIQDRVKLAPANRARFVEACEQAYHFGKGKLALHFMDAQQGIRNTQHFSNRLHCAQCDIEYREPSPALFSFNHPVGACPSCKGFGRVISIDYDLVIPDRSRTLAEGVVRPWHTGHGLESQSDLMRTCRHFEIPTDVPFEKLPKKWQDFVINGEPDHGKDEEHEWPRSWYGVKGYFRWLGSKAYKMHVRVLLSRYRAYTTCPVCNGARFQPETLLYLVDAKNFTLNSKQSEPGFAGSSGKLTLADFYQLPVRDAFAFVNHFTEAKKFKANDPIGLVFNEVRSRLGFLNDVGLSYLTLDRATRSLSGGETERVNLTTCLGTRLVNTLFVLDEPSVGLHPRDTEKLVRILEQLRNAGNTVVVVEHEASVMRAADQIIDIGPGHGAAGGEIVFQGTYKDILKSKDSLTGQYLSGRKEIEIPERRPVTVGSRSDRDLSSYGNKENLEAHGFALNDAPQEVGGRRDACPTLKLEHAMRHNLKDVSVEIPLGRFVCLTGVSGSGKTTLVREVLLPSLEAKLRTRAANLKLAAAKASEGIEDESEDEDESSEALGGQNSTELAGFENLGRVVLVDQSALGKTPRSNPAVYIGAFDDIREVFAQSEVAKQRGLNASAFSFNSAQGQCERCRGAGFEKIEMQFLSDVFIRCPACDGRRYRPHILEVKVHGTEHEWSVADVLEATVDEAFKFLCDFPESRAAVRAAESIKLLQEVGLGYLRLGQPINTLSGGESQRLKLVRHLAEATQNGDKQDACPTLFLFDEPTTGLHFDDVRVLLKVFQRLVDAGHSVVVIEHNLDVIKSADWVIDLGPGAGDEGGMIVAQGTPEEIAACDASPTGKFLRDLLSPRAEKSRIPDANGNRGSGETRYPKLARLSR